MIYDPDQYSTDLMKCIHALEERDAAAGTEVCARIGGSNLRSQRGAKYRVTSSSWGACQADSIRPSTHCRCCTSYALGAAASTPSPTTTSPGFLTKCASPLFVARLLSIRLHHRRGPTR